MAERPRILVLGIGNLLWADEGFGVRAVEYFNRRYEVPAQVEVVDGGTQGVYLLRYVQAADYLLVFDAIDYGLPPGTLKVVRDDEVPAFLGVKKMSMHQTGFQEVLACAQLAGRCPARMVLIGVQPLQLDDFGGSLSEQVKAQIDPAIDVALAQLAEWDVRPFVRQAEPAASQRLSPDGIDMDAYESGRPSAADACRRGDARVLFSTGGS